MQSSTPRILNFHLRENISSIKVLLFHILLYLLKIPWHFVLCLNHDILTMFLFFWEFLIAFIFSYLEKKYFSSTLYPKVLLLSVILPIAGFILPKVHWSYVLNWSIIFLNLLLPFCFVGCISNYLLGKVPREVNHMVLACLENDCILTSYLTVTLSIKF